MRAVFKIIMITFFALLIIKAKGGSENISKQDKISKEEALLDLDNLLLNIEEIHPNAYAFTSKEDILIEYDKVKKLINDSLTIYKFYHYLSYVAAKYGDGHISIIYPAKWYHQEYNYIPIAVNIDVSTHKLYVNIPDSNFLLPKGSEILEINDISASKIIDTMLVCQSGEAIAFRTKRCEEYFSQLLYSIYDIKETYKIKIKTKGHVQTKNLKGINYKSFKKLTNQTEPVNDAYKLKLIENNIYLIDFHEFSDVKRFNFFLDSTFSLIKNKEAENLIIDLRYNSGGDSRLGDELLKYITKEPFSQYSKMEWKISPQLKDLWKNYYAKQGFTMKLMSWFINQKTNGDIIVKENNRLTKPVKKSKRYNGNIYLLTSFATFSSAADLAWCFKHYKIGKVIGEETGGWGLCFGDNVYTELPITKLAINVSCRLFYNIGATKNSFHGVIPDIQVESDKALEKAISFIKEN